MRQRKNVMLYIDCHVYITSLIFSIVSQMVLYELFNYESYIYFETTEKKIYLISKISNIFVYSLMMIFPETVHVDYHRYRDVSPNGSLRNGSMSPLKFKANQVCAILKYQFSFIFHFSWYIYMYAWWFFSMFSDMYTFKNSIAYIAQGN